MNNHVLVCRRILRRHSEALLIIAFVLADCFLRGPALRLAALAAVMYVVLPALRAMLTLSPEGRLTFLKAFYKTPKVQRLTLLLFWLFGIRYLVDASIDANLFTITPGQHPAISSALIMGIQQLAPLAFLASPILTYAIACFIAIALRTRLKSTKKDPDLIAQRQKWSWASHYLFLSAFVGGILCITLYTNGPAYMISNWLLASGRDANLYYGAWEEKASTWPSLPQTANTQEVKIHDRFLEIPATGPSSPQMAKTLAEPAAKASASQKPEPQSEPVPQPVSSSANEVNENSGPEATLPEPYAPVLFSADADGAFSDLSFIKDFDAIVLSSFFSAAFLLLLQPVVKLNAFLTSFCWRVVSQTSLSNITEGFLEALRLPSRSLNFREAHPFWNNAVRTLLWLIACYSGLFWLFGFCGGPLGNAIQNWMMVSAANAGLFNASEAPNWIFSSQYRIALGAIVALYGTAPMAVMNAVFLPYAKPRQISVSCDGLTFAQGPYLTLWGRQFRLWSDLESFTVKKTAKPGKPFSAKFTLKFRSGGRITFNNAQISAPDLKIILDGIEQYAAACIVDFEVHAISQMLSELDSDAATSDGVTDTTIATIAKEEFKSTVFVPLSSGECLPNTQTRIIKQLASKPLCAVYLARNEDGQMVTVKQFYLADQNEETRALEKILKREYELLSALDHPGIAKVHSSFTHDNSTFLIIEHRLGNDMRAVVKEHGARSEGLTISWAKQICEIMKYLHGREAAILHRDLTPDNVIVGEDGLLRLIDFGAAREFLDGITGTMIGKHCYVAPEQLRGDASQKSDIYSFGCTLYFLLTGRDPTALTQSSPAKNIDCSDGIDRLIKDCTEFDEEKRPQSFEEVLTRLNELETGFKLKLTRAKVKALA